MYKGEVDYARVKDKVCGNRTAVMKCFLMPGVSEVLYIHTEVVKVALTHIHVVTHCVKHSWEAAERSRSWTGETAWRQIAVYPTKAQYLWLWLTLWSTALESWYFTFKVMFNVTLLLWIFQSSLISNVGNTNISNIAVYLSWNKTIIGSMFNIVLMDNH